MMRVRFSGWVEADLEVIAAFIARHNPVRSATFIEEIRLEFLRIAENPQMYRLRPDIGVEARSAAFRRYVILFRTVGDEVEIGRVYHGARRLPRSLF